MNNRLATLATIDALNEYIEDVRRVVLAIDSDAVRRDHDYGEVTDELGKTLDRLDVLVGQYRVVFEQEVPDPIAELIRLVTVREAIFDLEGHLEDALRKVRAAARAARIAVRHNH